LNVHGANDVRETGIHTAEPLVSEPSDFEVELVIEKLKSHKSPDIDQIPAELIKVESKTIRSEIRKLMIFIWNCLSNGMGRSLCLSIKRAIKQIQYLQRHVTFANYVPNFIQHPAVKVNSTCRGNYWI
jgi:hypothetical protein